jgi:hypothetical protein
MEPPNQNHHNVEEPPPHFNNHDDEEIYGKLKYTMPKFKVTTMPRSWALNARSCASTTTIMRRKYL